MAGTACPTCGRSISPAFPACRSCGSPNPQYNPRAGAVTVVVYPDPAIPSSASPGYSPVTHSPPPGTRRPVLRLRAAIGVIVLVAALVWAAATLYAPSNISPSATQVTVSGSTWSVSYVGAERSFIPPLSDPMPGPVTLPPGGTFYDSVEIHNGDPQSPHEVVNLTATFPFAVIGTFPPLPFYLAAGAGATIQATLRAPAVPGQYTLEETVVVD